MTRMADNRQIARRDDSELMLSGGDGGDVERTPPTALEAITRAEVDVQVATAKRFPRSMSKFLAEAKAMVALDPDLAAECTYYLPPRKNDKGEEVVISGPSIRLAEIVAACYTNLSIASRISDDDGKFITAQAVGFDAERNHRRMSEVKRNVVTKSGYRYGPDMVKTTCQAAMSIAERNVVFKLIPRAVITLIEEEAKRVAQGDVKTLPERTARAVGWFVGKGVPAERVFATLGIAGPEDMTLELLGRLNAMRTAVKEGHGTLQEAFPAPQAAVEPGEAAAPTKAGKLAQKLGGKGKTEAPAGKGDGAADPPGDYPDDGMMPEPGSNG